METQELKIPLERVGVLIGRVGEVKKRLEQKMHVHIHVDSSEGDVTISGEDSVTVYDAIAIVKAIGRGFNPSLAELLTSEEYAFELIDIQTYSGPSRKRMERLRGRVIGQEGKARKMIEEMTETHLSVYGKTIGIIGKVEMVALARQAVELLLEGSPHANVYHWLEQKQRDIKRRTFEEEKGF